MRVVAWLMYLVGSGQLGIDHLRFACDFRAGRLKRGLDDVWMRAAAAQVAGAGVFDLCRRSDADYISTAPLRS